MCNLKLFNLNKIEKNKLNEFKETYKNNLLLLIFFFLPLFLPIFLPIHFPSNFLEPNKAYMVTY